MKSIKGLVRTLKREVVGLASVFLLILAIPSYAQVLWDYADVVGDDGQEISSVLIDVVMLDTLEQGNVLEIRVSDTDVFEFILERSFRFENGDKTWHANLAGQDQYSLVITSGLNNAYASVSTPAGGFQLSASLLDNKLYEGQLKKLTRAYTPSNQNNRDYKDPNEVLNGLFRNSYAISIEGINAENFSISQSANVSVLGIGDHTEITLEFKNTGTELEENIFVDIFFILETAQVITTDSSCSEIASLSGQLILSCTLGNFAPDQEKSLTYEIEAVSSSHPNIISTAIVGEVRHDFFLDVYRDVVSDTDEDGISNFNEEILGTDPLDGFSVQDEITIIDVLALYTRSAAELYENDPVTRINQLISVANNIYIESGVKIQLRPVLLSETSYLESDDLGFDLDQFSFRGDEAFSGLDALRARSGADLLVLFRPMQEENNICGLAHLGAAGAKGDFSALHRKDFAYSVININCPDDVVLAHEAGHNMGLVHSRREEAVGGTFSYSAGYGVDDEFVTVMAGSEAFNSDNRIARFSNPDLLCGEFICGKDANDALEGADAATSLNQVRHQIAAYYTSVEQRLTNLNAISSSRGGEIGASIIAGASGDNGITYTDLFAAETSVDVSAIINPDESHIGLTASTHVIIRFADRGFFQLNDTGEFVGWDGNISNLLPIEESRLLNETNRVDLLENFNALDNGLAGQQVAIYIAYLVLDPILQTPELTYNSTPLVFNFNEALPVEIIIDEPENPEVLN